MTKSADAFRTISEVAEWLDTPAHVLRFWESKFSQVKPVKRAGGRRYYRPSDMELLGGIKRLLHDDGMTIKGVQKLLRDKGVAHVAALSQPLDDVTQAVRDAMTARKSPDEGGAAEVVEGQVSPASDGGAAVPDVDPAVQVETGEANPQPVGEPSESKADHITDTPGDVPATPEGFVPFGKKPGDGDTAPIEAPAETPIDSPSEAPAVSFAPVPEPPAPESPAAEDHAPAAQPDPTPAQTTSPVESAPAQTPEPDPVADAQPIQRPARDAVQAYAAGSPAADVTGGDTPTTDGVDMPSAIDTSPADAAQAPVPQDAGFTPQSKPGQDTRLEPPSIPTPLLAHICERDAPLSPGDIERAKELAGQLRDWLSRQAG